MRTRSLGIFIVCSLLIQTLSPVVSAQTVKIDDGFDPNRILEDADIFDLTGWSYTRVVSFLRSKGPLADYITTDIDGVPKTAAEIIWRVASSYRVNPKYLLALLQKEQSLVEDPAPTQKQYDWATGYGICDNCSKNDPDLQDFKGFANQVEWAAKQHREKYLLQLLGNGQTRAGQAPGKRMLIDGLNVTPTNNATAMLYSYTPHIHGNLNLWRIWQRWFSISFPDGTIVRAKNSGDTFLIRFGQKRKYASKSVMESLVNTDKIVNVSDTELEAYPDGPAIRFPKFALLQDSAKNIWLLTGESRRHISSTEAFNKFGFNEDEIIAIESDDQLNDYPLGEPITTRTEFPQGIVLQNNLDKSYWYVEGETRQLIPDAAFLSLYFRGRKVKVVAPEKLATYMVANTYPLHDGELVRAETMPSVYVVQKGVLKPIPSASVFEQLGYQWKNVVMLPDSLFTRYTVGDMLTAEPLYGQASL